MGGFGGSALAMIQSLRNNKMLLKGKKGFFRKGLPYSEIKAYYKDSTSPIPKGNSPTKEELSLIRSRLIYERKKLTLYRILIVFFFTVGLLMFINYSYNNFTIIKSLFVYPEKSNSYELF